MFQRHVAENKMRGVRFEGCSKTNIKFTGTSIKGILISLFYIYICLFIFSFICLISFYYYLFSIYFNIILVTFDGTSSVTIAKFNEVYTYLITKKGERREKNRKEKEEETKGNRKRRMTMKDITQRR